MSSHIAVFDIGKTNKKLLIYDENLKLIDTARGQFPEYTEGEVHLEPVEEMTEWYLDRLSDFSAVYNIRAVSVATQGATAVCVKKDGTMAVPPIAYTTEPGENFHKRFYERFGGIEKIHRTTATVPMGDFLNIAQLLAYYQETCPADFNRTEAILGFPQYFGYVLTGKAGAEPTYMGCHTLLWEHANNRWSYIAEGLGVLDKLPKRLSKSWDILGTITPEIRKRTGLPEDTVVTMGIHDSNASLLPYLVKMNDKMVLNSTGTWCAVMHPADSIAFDEDEIGKVVYYNLDIHARPVKTSIFLGGLEFEAWSEELKKINGKTDIPPFEPKLYKEAAAERCCFILPTIVQGSGQFPDSEARVVENEKTFTFADVQNGKFPGFFRDYNKSMAVLNLSIAAQTKVAMERVGLRNGMPIFTEGGFQKNPDYNALLTGMYPDSRVYLSNLSEATAFGAALLGKAALDKKDPLDLGGFFEIEQREVKKFNVAGLPGYFQAFLELLK
jgi:L-fuculokinase